jgi:hypothetical protein
MASCARKSKALRTAVNCKPKPWRSAGAAWSFFPRRVPLGLGGAQLHNLMVDRIQLLLVKYRPGKLLVMGYPLFVFDALIAHGNSAISFFS